MKKIFFIVLLLFSMISFGQQIDPKTDFEIKVVNIFKICYVEKTFKDPYSFKLLKLKITPITFGEWLQLDLYFTKTELQDVEEYNVEKYYPYSSKKELEKELRQHFFEQIKTYEELSNRRILSDPNFNKNELKNTELKSIGISKIEAEKYWNDQIENYEKKYSEMINKDSIKCYNIRIDCYGTNSYGANILGKYGFTYFKGHDDCPLNVSKN